MTFEIEIKYLAHGRAAVRTAVVEANDEETACRMGRDPRRLLEDVFDCESAIWEFHPELASAEGLAEAATWGRSLVSVGAREVPHVPRNVLRFDRPRRTFLVTVALHDRITGNVHTVPRIVQAVDRDEARLYGWQVFHSPAVQGLAYLDADPAFAESGEEAEAYVREHVTVGDPEVFAIEVVGVVELPEATPPRTPARRI